MIDADREELKKALARAVVRIRTARRDGRVAGCAAFEVWGERLRREEPGADDAAQLAALAADREAASTFLRQRARHAPDPAPVLAAAACLFEMAVRVRSAPAATPELAAELFDLEVAAAEHMEAALAAWDPPPGG